ncbi:gliding motility protein [Streptomyces sp. NPDC002055]|uniref:gliding motility protein n=1 Tax=Streptomyces sp. NPDC002055 TaxID=3154534 RepID=UPI0033319CDF
MGVFSRFRRRSSAASTDEAAAAPLTTESTEPAVDAEAASEESPKTTDGVEIPKQQSAEEAADSEAGEGARK